jgi:hypothetical protein
VLPTSPTHPTLKQVTLTYPINRFFDQRKTVVGGAHALHKYYLPSLKFWNPDLKIDVVRHPKAPSLLSLRFESHDEEALRNIATPSEKLTQQRDSDDPSTPQQPDYFDTDAPRPTAADDEITPVNPSSNDLYQRTVTLALRRRPAWEIFRWLTLRVGSGIERKGLTDQDRQQRIEHRQYLKDAEVIRARNKIVQAEADREKAAIAQARKAVDEAAKSAEATM